MNVEQIHVMIKSYNPKMIQSFPSFPPVPSKMQSADDSFPQLSFNELTDLKHIVHSVPAVVYTYMMNHDTGDCNFPFVSEYCREMFGLPPSKIVEDSETFVNLVHPDDVNAFAASVLESMKNMTTWDFKMRMRDSESRIVWIHGKSQPHRRQVINEDGSRVVYTIWNGVLYDITGDQIEGNEISSNTKLISKDDSTNTRRKLHSDEPYFETNINGEILFWNEHMTGLTDGLLEKDVFGKSLLSLESVSPQDQRNVKDILNNMFVQQDDKLRYFNESMHDIVLMSKTARTVELRISTERLNGDLIGWTCKDKTKLKTAGLLEMDASKLLDQEKSLTEWLSHEIRNPLSIAQEAAKFLLPSNNYPSTISDEEKDGDTHSLASLVIESIRHVVDLLNNMLDLRKLSDGKILLRPSMYSLKEDIIRPVHQMMDVKGHNVAMSISGEDFSVYIDKLRLKQILTNLISNALKFTHEGTIKIRSYRITKDFCGNSIAESLEISVSDTGPGINSAEKNKLFSKWEKLGTIMHGAGLGLCLSRFLARSMGGDLYLNENYNSGVDGYPGAQFVIRFPLEIILASAKDGCSTHTAPAYTALSSVVKINESEHEIKITKDISEIKYRDDLTQNSCIKGKFQIAIVDDVEVVRKLIKRRLKRIFPDAVLKEFHCGEKVIEATKQEQFDMIFIDQFMGDGLKGDETIVKLRENNVTSYIVGISGNQKEMCHKTAGGDDFFLKPLPSQMVLLQRLTTKVTTPLSWRVMIVDQNSSSSSLLKRKLHRVATVHPTKSSIIERHMEIDNFQLFQDAERKLMSDWYDLVIVASNGFHNNHETTGIELIHFARKYGQNKKAIVILNSAIMHEEVRPQLYNIFWPKPLPALEDMRKDLLDELIQP